MHITTLSCVLLCLILNIHSNEAYYTRDPWNTGTPERTRDPWNTAPEHQTRDPWNPETTGVDQTRTEEQLPVTTQSPFCTHNSDMTVNTMPQAEEITGRTDQFKVTVINGEILTINATSHCSVPASELTISSPYTTVRGSPVRYSCPGDYQETAASAAYRVNNEHSVEVTNIQWCNGYRNTKTHIYYIEVLRGPNLVVRPPKNTAVRSGSSVKIECSINRLENDFFEWLAFTSETGPGGRRIYLSGTGITDPSKYDIDGTYDLIIKNLVYSDGGTYRCRLLVQNTHLEAQLTILEPVACVPPMDSEVEYGYDVEMTCSVDYTGHEAPLLTWSGSALDGREVFNGTNEKQAVYQVYQNATWDSEGVLYTCNLNFPVKSHNPAPPAYTDSCQTRFYVLEPVNSISTSPGLSYPGHIIKVRVGYVIYCHARGRPLPIYIWTRIRGEGPRTVYGNSLQVTSVMAGEVNEYECLAENMVKGERYREKISISFFANETLVDVLEPPEHVAVRLYQSAMINCTVSSDYTSDNAWLQWYFTPRNQAKRRIFDSRNPSDIDRSRYSIEGTYNLIINSVNYYDTGTYECRLMPSEIELEAELVALGYPRCMVSSQAVVDGDLVEVTCETTKYGNLFPRIRMVGEGIGYLPTTNTTSWNDARASSVLVASYIYHNMQIRCEIDFEEVPCDPAGSPDYTDVCHTSFEVTAPVRNLTITPELPECHGRFRSGDELYCSSSSNPTPSIGWRKLQGGGTDKETGSSLRISSDMTWSLNVYECRAWNEINGREYEVRQTISFYVV